LRRWLAFFRRGERLKDDFGSWPKAPAQRAIRMSIHNDLLDLVWFDLAPEGRGDFQLKLDYTTADN
jgi:hypothetical protein